MSWSASVSSVRAGEAGPKLREAFKAAYPKSSIEVQQQVEAVVRVLDTVVMSVTPEVGVLVNVVASGHANPNHHKTEGWANDTLTVTVSQV